MHKRLDVIEKGKEMAHATMFSRLHDALPYAETTRELREIEAQIRDCREDAKQALYSLFLDAIESRGSIPTTDSEDCDRIVEVPVLDWITETMGTHAGTDYGVRMAMDAGERDKVLSEIASEYADDNAGDLLRAGWEAQS